MMGIPWYLGNSRSTMYDWGWGIPGFIVPLAIWSAIWSALALWHAARRQEKGWFIFFLLVHTAGIIELIYLIFVVRAFSKEKPRRRRK